LIVLQPSNKLKGSVLSLGQMHFNALEGFELTKQWYIDNPGRHPLKIKESRVASFVQRTRKRKNELSEGDIQDLETIPGWDWEVQRKSSKHIAILSPLGDIFNPLCTTRQSQLEWMAGFLAGDGCISIASTHIQVKYMQSEKGVCNLQYIKRLEGGEIYYGAKAKDSHQQGFVLVMNVDTSTRHMTNLRDVMTHKKRQVDIALEFPRNMYLFPTSEREEIRTKRQLLVEESKKLKQNYDEDIDDSKLTLYFLGGFFAAEGCVSLTRRGLPVINIAQKSLKMLESIQRFWGFGYVSSGIWSTTTRDDAEIFTRVMLGRSGCKDTMLQILLGYISECNVESRKRSKSYVSEERITFYRERLKSLNGNRIVPLKSTIVSQLRMVETQTGLPIGLSARGRNSYRYRIDGKVIYLNSQNEVKCREDAIRVYGNHLNELADQRAMRIEREVIKFTV